MIIGPGADGVYVAAASKVAIETHTEVFANRFKGEFVTAQLEVANSNSSTSTEDYYEHQKQCGFYDLPAQKSALLSDRNPVELTLSMSAFRTNLP